MKQKLKKFLSSHWLVLVIISLVLVLIIVAPTIYAKLSTRNERYNANNTPLTSIPYRPVALVFGAGIYDGDKPTLYLANRVRTAVMLYKAGRVGQIVMTGDNSRKGYDEPTVMKAYAIKLGMDPAKMTLDYAGYSTYDSCYRAKAIFQLKQVTVVTQGYHLPRAVMLCNDLGVEAIGVAAVRQSERDWEMAYVSREFLSTWKALIEEGLHVRPAVLGKPEPLSSRR